MENGYVIYSKVPQSIDLPPTWILPLLLAHTRFLGGRVIGKTTTSLLVILWPNTNPQANACMSLRTLSSFEERINQNYVLSNSIWNYKKLYIFTKTLCMCFDPFLHDPSLLTFIIRGIHYGYSFQNPIQFFKILYT